MKNERKNKNGVRGDGLRDLPSELDAIPFTKNSQYVADRPSYGELTELEEPVIE